MAGKLAVQAMNKAATGENFVKENITNTPGGEEKAELETAE